MLADSSNTGLALPIFDYFSTSESCATTLSSFRAAANIDKSTADQLPKDSQTELLTTCAAHIHPARIGWPAKCPAAPTRQLPMQAYSSRNGAAFDNAFATQPTAFRQEPRLTQAASQTCSISKLIRNASPITSAQALLARVLDDGASATAAYPCEPATAKAGAPSAQAPSCHQNPHSLMEMVDRSVAEAITRLPAANVGTRQGPGIAGRAVAGSSPEEEPRLKRVKCNEPLQAADSAEVSSRLPAALRQRIETEDAFWRSQQDQALIRVDDPVDFTLEGPFVTHSASSHLPLSGQFPIMPVLPVCLAMCSYIGMLDGRDLQQRPRSVNKAWQPVVLK